MELNFPVLAAADGTITMAEDIGGFCGVRVAIQHEKGWETSYCHLKEDSLTVEKGDRVAMGYPIGSVGMSGQADWPRLSFATIRNGLVFDPFSGKSTLEPCETSSDPLWLYDILPPYEPASIAAIGFTVGMVKDDDILNGTAERATAIRSDTPQIALWTLLFNVRKEDKLTFILSDPEGTIINKVEFTADEDYDRYPLFMSTLRKNITPWATGYYRGIISIERQQDVGEPIINTRVISVELREK